MLRFRNKSQTERSGQALPTTLGKLERCLMEVLWKCGLGSVRDVIERLERPLAYTTVMTTLDRLFKKGMLTRQKAERAFVYAPRFSRREWEERRAGALVDGYLRGPEGARDLLLSCFVEAVGRHDSILLESLEKKIRAKRRELDRRRQ